MSDKQNRMTRGDKIALTLCFIAIAVAALDMKAKDAAGDPASRKSACVDATLFC